jgi:enoyl-CoA hydratase/carnithine racemase
MLLTGREVPAPEALQIGLVHKVVAAAELMDVARAWAAELAAMAPLAVQAIIEAVNRGLEMALPAANFLESTLFGMTLASEDGHEGTRAFLEKRQARFKGR